MEEQITAAIAGGDRVVLRGFRDALGDLVQYLDLAATDLGRDARFDREAQAALARHYSGPAPIVESANADSYWRAVNP